MSRSRSSRMAAILCAAAFCGVVSVASLGRGVDQKPPAQPKQAVVPGSRAQGAPAAGRGAGQAQPPHAQTADALAKRSGCFRCHGVEKGTSGPAFQDIAARYRNDAREFDLRFLSVAAAKDLPGERKSTVIVARVGDELHIRIFDAAGRTVVDKAEAKLAKGAELTALKEVLKGDRLPEGAGLPAAERRTIIERASSIAGYNRASAREALVETVKKGGKGNWTNTSHGVPMPPFAGRLSDAEIRRLVDWVLRPTGSVELRILKMGLGSGTVTSNPPGIDCGSDCGEAYARGATVTLTRQRRRVNDGTARVLEERGGVATPSPRVRPRVRGSAPRAVGEQRVSRRWCDWPHPGVGRVAGGDSTLRVTAAERLTSPIPLSEVGLLPRIGRSRFQFC